MKAGSIGKNFWIRLILLFFLVFIYCFLLYKVHASVTAAGIFSRRVELITLLFAFALLHVFCDIRTMYDRIFRYRVQIALALLAFLVANNINCSSINAWNSFIEPSAVPEDSVSIFGSPRAIRSDEWNVNVPRMMSGSYSDYGRYNDIVRGVRTENISASGLYRDYSALAKPYYYGYYLFDFSHGLSFQWSYVLIFGFLFAFEFFYVLTGKRLAGIFGAALLWFSPFCAWWSLPIPLLSFCALPVLFYYMLRADRLWKRGLFSGMLAIAGADFVCVFYPAWQVPAGWILLTLIVFFLYRYREWKTYHLADWAVIVGAVAFMASIILRYCIADMSYIRAVSETVYPGARYDNGEMAMQKLLGYVPYYFLGFFKDGAVSPNNCESASFLLVFPLAYILVPIALVRTGREKRNGYLKGRRQLLFFLMFPLALLTLYCTTGLPAPVAKILLMNHSIGCRAVDFLGALLVIVTVVSVSVIRDAGGLRWYLSALIAIGSVLPAYFYGKGIMTDPDGPVVETGAIISVLLIFLLLDSYDRKAWNAAVVCGAYFLTVCALSVNPFTFGISVITDKPVAKAVQGIVSEDKSALWISASDNQFAANYLIANGARTLNSVNYIPNLSLWQKLDPDGSQEEIYNRYARVVIHLKDTEEPIINLPVQDAIELTIGPDDFGKLGAKYIFATEPVNDAFADELQMIYKDDAGEVFIYKNLSLND